MRNKYCRTLEMSCCKGLLFDPELLHHEHWIQHNVLQKPYKFYSSERKIWLIYLKMRKLSKRLPKIILAGAHTSTNLFLCPLMTQWYLNFSTETQFWYGAILLQFFLVAALSHSVFVVGQNSTFSTLLTASWQYLSWFVINCCRNVFYV